MDCIPYDYTTNLSPTFGGQWVSGTSTGHVMESLVIATFWTLKTKSSIERATCGSFCGPCLL